MQRYLTHPTKRPGSPVNREPRFSLPSRALLNLFSPGGARSRLSILIYHRVLPQSDPLFPAECDAQRFDAEMGWLKACFSVIPLSDAVRGLRKGKLPPRAACVTFDDGYADNAEVALPILQKYGIPVTVFVAANFLDGGRMWNDTVIELIRGAPGDSLDLAGIDFGKFEIGTIPQRRHAISRLLNKLKYLSMESRQAMVDAMSAIIPVVPSRALMMTSGQVRTLHNAGMEIGGHTVNHPILARMEKDAAYAEIGNGKEILEGIIRAPVRLFAYPNGKPGRDYLADHVEMVKNLGFDAAVSTAGGAATTGSDLYQLPRFTPWDRGQVRFTLRMVQNMLRTVERV
ncbi:MAG: polysaccharide deacetylase family protein [Nitrosospira sp.]|nr:polysaccharide deacetylase family protein [Nitrosospira sp.]